MLDGEDWFFLALGEWLLCEHLCSVHKIRTDSAVPGSSQRVKETDTLWKGNWYKYPRKRERNPKAEVPLSRKSK